MLPQAALPPLEPLEPELPLEPDDPEEPPLDPLPPRTHCTSALPSSSQPPETTALPDELHLNPVACFSAHWFAASPSALHEAGMLL